MEEKSEDILRDNETSSTDSDESPPLEDAFVGDNNTLTFVLSGSEPIFHDEYREISGRCGNNLQIYIYKS